MKCIQNTNFIDAMTNEETIPSTLRLNVFPDKQ
jgi:hypothetical protein